jgi:DNA phosphorothioation-associated putative methyltransferase
MNNSAKTAIHRTTISAPLATLVKNKLIHGSVLDYGCGHGKDLEYLQRYCIDADGYDLNHRPDPKPLQRKWDTVLCTYVLNVIENENERNTVIETIKGLVNPGGNVYITVRNDIKSLNGKTDIDTWQGLITLDLPIIRKNSTFITYHYAKNNSQPNLHS